MLKIARAGAVLQHWGARRPMTTQSIDPGLFTGGALSQLPDFPNTVLSGTELFEIVIANVANYSITSAALAVLINGYSYQNTIITSGATLASPYTVPTTVTRALLNKTIASASYVVFGLASAYSQPVLVRDLKGDAGTFPINITFTGGELCDGLALVDITNPYGGYILNPLSSGGWYLGLF